MRWARWSRLIRSCYLQFVLGLKKGLAGKDKQSSRYSADRHCDVV